MRHTGCESQLSQPKFGFVLQEQPDHGQDWCVFSLTNIFTKFGEFACMSNHVTLAVSVPMAVGTLLILAAAMAAEVTPAAV